ncbi:hypothetical protein [Alteribacter natronophilus]|uniref:hypothetical protein n=1 Tax=Alteribacter natronophilus TaxID=2583810 RepID=UPI00110EC091|nr:hypothetical protein [Alteribacter natronophilus]TMW70523.1 hypothetical protein FGB90_15135 [Alteribacter natronophilus]
MKQFLPIILIVGIIAGAMFFFQEPAAQEEAERDWTGTNPALYSMGGGPGKWDLSYWADYEEAEETVIGIDLTYKDEDSTGEVEAVEVFIQFHNPYGVMYYQELEIEDFDGSVAIHEVCDFCTEKAQAEWEERFGGFGGSGISGYMEMSWISDGAVYETGTELSFPQKVLQRSAEEEN